MNTSALPKQQNNHHNHNSCNAPKTQANEQEQSQPTPKLISLDIFCNVIDNYGDAGVCLHLARALSKLNYQVKLWCNNMSVLQTLTIPSDHNNPLLQLAAWEQELTSYQPAQVVISAFSCHLDQNTRTALSQHPEPLNINLEYLSAEEWVESCHMLPSPQDGYTSYFFFPGFTAKTGGLNVDHKFTNACRTELLKQQQLILHKEKEEKEQEEPEENSSAITTARTISLFGYDNPTVLHLIQSLQKSSRPTLIKVFTGLALDNLNQLLGLNLQVGDRYQDHQVTIEVLPMLTHEEYDQILLHSDFNLVRGEDSIVRAIHTGHPFLWQIYPQDEDTHIIKLKSFLEQVKRINLENAKKQEGKDVEVGREEKEEQLSYLPLATTQLEQAYKHFSQVMLAYNGSGSWPEDFDFDHFTKESNALCYNLAIYLCHQEPLAIRLAQFIAQKLQQQ